MASQRTSATPLVIHEHRVTLQKAIDSIVQRFGKGAIMALGGDPGERQSFEVVSTGSLNLDRALGVGGLPRGRIVEIYGPESSGKTTLMLHAIAEAQRQKLACAFIDAEHALDVKYAQRLGVRLEDLLISQPDCGEQALDIVDTLARTGSMGLIVIDSVAALIPRAELEGDMGDQHLGLQARLMSQAMRKIAGIAFQTNTLVVFINQLRHKIGVTFGSPETTTGGNALKYFASVRLDIRRIATVRDGEDAVASRCRVKVVKNKCAPPFTEAQFEIAFGTGIARDAEVLDWALGRNVITKAGSWFSFGDIRIGQGRAAALEWLRTHPGERDGLLTRAMTDLAVPSSGEQAEEEEARAA
ncbi:recombinase RecA [Nannocystis pusilla]|uniref:Protein RecA n=1 Tax=Nannocystis pusilla TaxID=889268 RepID=A0ABS7TSX3_9BACT|nr:recombinase RecA [Nannocystis pusilla]MBZ5711329.1 recombinase RecA [Nannocystis pusilla]